MKINRTDGVLRSFPKGSQTTTNSSHQSWQKGREVPPHLGFEPLFLADPKFVLHVCWGLQLSLDEVFSFYKIICCFLGVSLSYCGFDLVLMGLWLLTSQVSHCTSGMNTFMFVLCTPLQLWSFFLCAQSPRPWQEDEEGIPKDHGSTGKAQMSPQAFWSNCIPKAAHVGEKEWALSGDVSDPSSRSNLFWIMTFDLFPTQNIYHKMPRKILF